MNSLDTGVVSTNELNEGSEKILKSVLFVMPQTNLFAGEDFVGNSLITLAGALSKAGHKVSLLVMDHGSLSKEEVATFSRQCAEAALTLRYIVRDKYVHLAGQKCACDSYLLYQWLSENEHFDVVHLPEWSGLGYYSQLAKKQGLALQTTQFIVGIFGPTLLRNALSQMLIADTENLALDFIERQSVKLADAVFAPMPLYLDILHSLEWDIPMSQYRLQFSGFNQKVQYERASSTVDSQPQPSTHDGKIEELVYLGVMEERDGIGAFCNALDQLTTTLPKSCRITFLGASSSTVGRNAESYIATRAQRWPWSWQFIHSEKSGDAIQYLKSGARLAVIGSSTTNSLLLASQCVANNVPVLCNTLSRGTIHADFSTTEQYFFSDDANLAEKLQHLQANGKQATSKNAITPEHRRWWVDAHQNIFTPSASEEVKTEFKPLVSVCMAHYNRPHFLRQALESLKAQDYSNIEVIVGDDGSNGEGVDRELKALEAEIADRKWTILRLPHKNVGATRSAAANAARGEYLLFMDDDNYAHPHEVSTLVSIAASTNADIVTCFFDAFEGEVLPEPGSQPIYRKVFLGAAANCGLTENVFW